MTKTKQVLAPLGRTPVGISRNFLCQCAPWPLTYIPSFIQIHSGLGSLTENPSATPKVITI